MCAYASLRKSSINSVTNCPHHLGVSVAQATLAMQPHQCLRLQQQTGTAPITTYGQRLRCWEAILGPVMMMFDDDDDRGDSDGDNQKEKSSQPSTKMATTTFGDV